MNKAILPLYYQIKQVIKDWITNREFEPGDRIPSESEISANFDVNRLTVRQAIAELVQEGFLSSRKGKGTFVTTDEDLVNSFSLESTGFIDSFFYQVRKTKTASVEIGQIVPAKWIKEKLKLDEACKDVTEIKRVRLNQAGKKFAYTINYLPAEIGRKITKTDLFRKPLVQILEQDLGIQISEAFQTIGASFANQEVGEKLEIASGSPILFAERIVFTKRKTPVEMVQSSYRGDLYKYIVRLKNITKKGERVWVHDD